MSPSSVPTTTQIQTSPRFYLVDDNSTHIRYSPGWSQTIVSNKNYTAAGLASFPIYGTVHTYDTTDVNPANFSFTFSGTFVEARFIQSTSNDIVSCEVDGKNQSMAPSGGCASVNLADGEHELVMAFTTSLFNPYIFDYIRYIPSANVTAPVGDVWIGFADPSVSTTSDSALLAAGQTLDVNFSGTSLSIYTASVNTDSHQPTEGFYTIDGNHRVNITIENTSTNLTNYIYPQLVIQTPQFAPGTTHSLHLALAAPPPQAQAQAQGSPETVPLRGTIVFQNSSWALEAFPHTAAQLPSGNTLSQSPSQRHRGPIIGGTLGGVALFSLSIAVIVLILVRRRRRRRQVKSESSAKVISPFIAHRVVHLFSGRLGGEKGSGSGSGMGMGMGIRMGTGGSTSTSAISGSSSTPLTRPPPPPRIRMHEDSGETIAQPDASDADDAVTIDLPPSYEGIRATLTLTPRNPHPNPNPQNPPISEDTATRDNAADAARKNLVVMSWQGRE